MAPQFFGAGAPFVTTVTTANANLESPASVPAGAVMLAAISMGSPSVILTAPAGEGWQHVLPVSGTVEQFSGGSGLSQRLLWKVSDGSEPATHNFVLSATQAVQGQIFAYTGVDTDNPLDVIFQALADSTSDTNITLPAITPITAGAIVVRFGAHHSATTAATGITAPSGHTSRGFFQTGGTIGKRPGGWSDKVWSGSGAEAQTTAVVTGGANGISGGISLALKPAASSDTTPPSNVTGLSANASGSQVPLTWNAATDNIAVVGYSVFRATSPGGTYAQVGTSSTLGYTDAPPAAGTYYYVVKARDAAGNVSAAYSNEVSGTTTGVASGTVRYRRLGRVTPSGFTAAAQFENTTNARLKVSTSADLLTSPVFFGPVAVDAQGYVKVAATGLNANTRYYYGWEADGTMTAFVSGQTNHGNCKTFPAADLPASFDFISGSCQTNSSNSAVFTQIAAENPLFLIHDGDEHYSDINSTNQADYRTVYEQQIAQTNQQVMECLTPMVYMYNDHDFCGNNSGRDWVGNGTVANVGRAAVQAVYRQIFPHYNLPATTGAIWQTFEVGRFKFFMMDTRSESTHRSEPDNSSKTKLGAEQKAAFKQWLLDNPKAPKIIVTNEVFHSSETTGDGWGVFSTERQELVDFISNNSITNGVFIAGDQHAVSYADAADGTPAGWPCISAGPFDQNPSHKGGPWAERSPDPIVDSVTRIQQYGKFMVTDSGGATATLTVGFRNVSGATLLGPDNVITFTNLIDEPTETMRPTGVTGLSPAGFTGSYTDIDQDPDDATITDAGLVHADPSGQSGTTDGPNLLTSQATSTGLTTLTTPANAVDASETTAATSAMGAIGAAYGNFFGFTSNPFTDIPAGATLEDLTLEALQDVSSNNRSDQFFRLDSTNGTAITSVNSIPAFPPASMSI